MSIGYMLAPVKTFAELAAIKGPNAGDICHVEDICVTMVFDGKEWIQFCATEGGALYPPIEPLDIEQTRIQKEKLSQGQKRFKEMAQNTTDIELI